MTLYISGYDSTLYPQLWVYYKLLTAMNASFLPARAFVCVPPKLAIRKHLPVDKCRKLLTQAFDEDALNDTIGVASLLERDRKEVRLVEGAFDDNADMSTVAPPSPPKKRKSQHPSGDTISSSPQRCRDAMQAGLQLMEEKKYKEAIDMFQLSLELPGNGFMRISGSPIEYACPSEAEENAGLYNMACAWALLGQKKSALTCLEALLDNNFEDIETIRRDPDLASLRGSGLENLLSSKQSQPFTQFFNKGAKNKNTSNEKPWLQW